MEKELIYIFGKHAVYEALVHRPSVVRELYIENGFVDEKIFARLSHTKVKPRLLNPKRLPGGLRNDAVHQGIIAGILVSDLMVSYKDFIASHNLTSDSCFLVLGEVQDPHNVGAVIRSAAAMGVSGVLIPPHNQAPVNGTVVKVSAGMAFRIPLVEIRNVNATLHDLKERGCWVYGLAGEEGARSVTSELFTKPTVFVLGNEGSGLREKTRQACDDLIAIPMHPRCESLNAAASAAIVMYAWSAQHAVALSPKTKTE
jgi:23S rRNA (guanosine2251-2'-O)-methyltransferase